MNAMGTGDTLANHDQHEEGEMDLVVHWLRKDVGRWIAGAISGGFAGLVAFGVAMAFSKAAGLDLWFPVKLYGTVLLGPYATELGTSTSGIIAGLVVIEIITGFWGIIFSHFVFSNKLSALLPMGVVWGAFSWVFIWNLFSQSFKPIFAAQVGSGAAFVVCMAYGLSLSSLKVIDRIFRK